MMIKYRIAWNSSLTDKEGHGAPVWTDKEAAEDAVKDLNERHPAIRHWVEAVEVEEPQK